MNKEKIAELGELKSGDLFYTEYYYALKDTTHKCNTFVVIGFTKNNKVKCLACNYRYPQMFYFKKNKKVMYNTKTK